MILKRRGEFLQLITTENGITREHTFKPESITRIVHVKEKGFCQVFLPRYDFQVCPESMGCKDGEQLNKKLRRLMKRPIFRWY